MKKEISISKKSFLVEELNSVVKDMDAILARIELIQRYINGLNSSGESEKSSVSSTEDFKTVKKENKNVRSKKRN